MRPAQGTPGTAGRDKLRCHGPLVQVLRHLFTENLDCDPSSTVVLWDHQQKDTHHTHSFLLPVAATGDTAHMASTPLQVMAGVTCDCDVARMQCAYYVVI